MENGNSLKFSDFILYKQWNTIRVKAPYGRTLQSHTGYCWNSLLGNFPLTTTTSRACHPGPGWGAATGAWDRPWTEGPENILCGATLKFAWTCCWCYMALYVLYLVFPGVLLSCLVLLLFFLLQVTWLIEDYDIIFPLCLGCPHEASSATVIRDKKTWWYVLQGKKYSVTGHLVIVVLIGLQLIFKLRMDVCNITRTARIILG